MGPDQCAALCCSPRVGENGNKHGLVKLRMPNIEADSLYPVSRSGKTGKDSIWVDTRSRKRVSAGKERRGRRAEHLKIFDMIVLKPVLCFAPEKTAVAAGKQRIPWAG